MQFFFSSIVLFACIFAIGHTLPECKLPSVALENGRHSGGHRRTQFPIGFALKYWCKVGYKLKGNQFVKCIHRNGLAIWSTKPPVCIKLHNDRSNSNSRSDSSSNRRRTKCPLLRSPQWGTVTVSGRRIGSRATYKCHFGRLLKGNKHRTCLKGGHWSGTQPQCLKIVKCKVLKNPSNGKVFFTNTVEGSVAKYACNIGYVLVGRETRVCLKNGKWSNTPPYCKSKDIDCGDPGIPVNGKRQLLGTRVTSVVKYSCNNGFILVGMATRRCLQSGKWSGSLPICKAVVCKKLLNPSNGKVILRGNSGIGSVAVYICNSGFSLAGQKSRTCLSTGKWSGRKPTCTRITCQVLKNPANGLVRYSDGLNYGSIATYTCNKGYFLHEGTTATRTCYGNWSGAEPKCYPIDCGSLPAPVRGMVQLSGTKFGSVANYSCFHGYELVGTRSRVCLLNKMWSNEAPICRAIDCGILEAPVNGRVDFTATTFTSLATYYCNEGFHLNGQETRECQVNGKWSGNEPQCTEIICKLLESPPNGDVILSGVTNGSKAVYTCQSPGFILKGGSEVRVCSNGQWTGTAPYCDIIKEKGCETLLDPDYGHVRITGSDVGIVGSQAHYTCDIGFVITKGNKVRTCQHNYIWSGSPAVCERIQCPLLNDISNGYATYSSRLFESVASYTCFEGYNLIGPTLRVCQANGTWSGGGQDAFCISSDTVIRCEDPGELDNGQKKFVAGAGVLYTCDEGYILLGQRRRVCQPNGQFSGSQPICVQVKSTCTGNTIDYNQCGHKCDCINGRHVNCCRVRKDWASLTAEEKQRYIDAVKELASDPVYKPEYESLLEEHKLSFKTNAQSNDPSKSLFIPYSRSFLYKYEKLLHQIDCKIMVPFWDISAFPVLPYQNPVWSNEDGFGNSSRVSDHCLQSGPFNYREFSTPNGTCIQRLHLNKTFPSRDIIERDLLPLPAVEFNNFHRQLQLLIGLNTLCHVGGNLCSNTASYDPVFPLYLSYIDSIYDRWQRFKVGRETVRFSDDHSPLPVNGEYTVSQFNDNSNLPNGVSICYDPPRFHKRYPHPSVYV